MKGMNARPTHQLPHRTLGLEVYNMEIGKPEREITIEPIKAPKESPAPAPAPIKEPEPVGV